MTCSIRKWALSDAPALAHALNNPKIHANLRDGLPFPYTEQDALSYISSMLSADEDSVFAFAIVVNGQVAGSIGAFRQSNIHSRTAEIGYYLAEPFWGQGAMTRALGLCCAHVFTHTDILRIFAEPFSRNAASRRVLEKNAFLHEGTLRRNAVKDGAVLDMEMYSLLREDWEAGSRQS